MKSRWASAQELRCPRVDLPEEQIADHRRFRQLLAQAKGRPAMPTAIVHPCDDGAIVAATEAANAGLIEPILAGPAAQIKATAKHAGVDIAAYRLLDAPHSHAAAQAVALVKSGETKLLMKGSLHTDALMHAVVAALEKLVPLAPLHQPHNIAAVRAINSPRPDLPQVACFDTAFHHDMPSLGARLYTEEGVRRYGFLGLFYEYLIARLRELSPGLLDGPVIAAHLGNGASLCATRNGRSIDTTMGFTTLDGLVMGTRCGGIECDAEANARHEPLISTSRSRVLVFVIATDEEAMLAEHTAHVIPAFPE